MKNIKSITITDHNHIAKDFNTQLLNKGNTFSRLLSYQKFNCEIAKTVIRDTKVVTEYYYLDGFDRLVCSNTKYKLLASQDDEQMPVFGEEIHAEEVVNEAPAL